MSADDADGRSARVALPKYTPRIIDHLEREGRVWYRMRTAPNATPEWYTRNDALAASEEVVNHYDRCHLQRDGTSTSV